MKKYLYFCYLKTWPEGKVFINQFSCKFAFKSGGPETVLTTTKIMFLVPLKTLSWALHDAAGEKAELENEFLEKETLHSALKRDGNTSSATSEIVRNTEQSNSLITKLLNDLGDPMKQIKESIHITGYYVFVQTCILCSNMTYKISFPKDYAKHIYESFISQSCVFYCFQDFELDEFQNFSYQTRGLKACCVLWRYIALVTKLLFFK